MKVAEVKVESIGAGRCCVAGRRRDDEEEVGELLRVHQDAIVISFLDPAGLEAAIRRALDVYDIDGA